MSKPKSFRPIDWRTAATLGPCPESWQEKRIAMIFHAVGIDANLGQLLWSLHVSRQMLQQEITVAAIAEDEDRLARSRKIAADIGDLAFFEQVAFVDSTLRTSPDENPIPKYLAYYVEAASRIGDIEDGDWNGEPLPAAVVCRVVNRWLVADGFPHVSLELIAGKMNTLKIARPGRKNKKDRN
jgi:hypothetical protein